MAGQRLTVIVGFTVLNAALGIVGQSPSHVTSFGYLERRL
ncbi:hypothetical protein MycrhN_5011 [Mycolicibacterium rhodesiae NBB3]|uniref:Uncharacterized protein n=1 Tax=Mycolicibacterium rhodesiae (strain NBB3) TaxID=710685 RepID=G8RVQ7_MYCRN|nr:hypothetical protein MycrhN_5011 [Mycolicibacterium rhodesiae NBB3]